MLPPKSTHAIRQHRRRAELWGVACFVAVLGWAGGIYLGTTCFLASLPEVYGQYGVEFDAHIGLWQYSPAGSTLAGYPYCTPYGDAQAVVAPLVSRMFYMASLATGTFSLGVLWHFLFTGLFSLEYWNFASVVAFMACICELLTLLVYVGSACRQHGGCQWGLGSTIIPIASLAWLVLALELRYQAPFIAMEKKIADKEERQKAKQEPNWRSVYKPPPMLSS